MLATIRTFVMPSQQHFTDLKYLKGHLGSLSREFFCSTDRISHKRRWLEMSAHSNMPSYRRQNDVTHAH
jgi:hypothetical protein